MDTSGNRQRMHEICAELAQGNTRPFVDAMADDVCWHVTGSTAWSGSYRGKQAVREKLFARLFAQFATPYRNQAQRILADGDHVIVECHGEVTTHRGEPYNNRYCWVIRMQDGRIQDVTDYLDTALLEAALDPPTA